MHAVRKDLGFKQQLEEHCNRVANVLKRARECPAASFSEEAELCWASKKQLTSYRRLVSHDFNYVKAQALQSSPEMLFSSKGDVSGVVSV